MFLLLTQPLRGEHGVRFCIRNRSDVVEDGDELRVAHPARLAVGEMFHGGRIERLTTTVGEITFDETVVLQMFGTSDHDFAPRRARSFRAARNRWTRTVD